MSCLHMRVFYSSQLVPHPCDHRRQPGPLPCLHTGVLEHQKGGHDGHQQHRREHRRVRVPESAPVARGPMHQARGAWLHVRIACHSTTAPTRTTTVAARRPNGGRARRTRACCAYLAPHQARPSPSRHVGAMQRIAAAPRASAAARRHACRTSRPAELRLGSPAHRV